MDEEIIPSQERIFNNRGVLIIFNISLSLEKEERRLFLERISNNCVTTFFFFLELSEGLLTIFFFFT